AAPARLSIPSPPRAALPPPRRLDDETLAARLVTLSDKGALAHRLSSAEAERLVEVWRRVGAARRSGDDPREEIRAADAVCRSLAGMECGPLFLDPHEPRSS